MNEWLALWGLAPAASFVFRPVLEALAKDAAKDFAKDFCKDSLKHVLGGSAEWKKATGKALKEFLEQFEQELIGAGETELTLQNYTSSLKQFTGDSSVRLVIGSAIIDPNSITDHVFLGRKWEALELERLPNDFDWRKLGRRYHNKALTILRNDGGLRAILDSQILSATKEAVQRIAGVSPGFNLQSYCDNLSKRYGYLKLETLDADPEHGRIALSKVFVEQTVRPCAEFNLHSLELPKEKLRQLKDSLEIKPDSSEDKLDHVQKHLRQSPRPVLETISKKDRESAFFVILGDPGSGKSVLLQFIALEWAQASPDQRSLAPIPLLIELKTYVETLQNDAKHDFLDYFDAGVGCIGHLDKNELHRYLELGYITFLLDGLDEIFDLPTRHRVISQIIDFTARFPLCRFVLTSRVVGYECESLKNAGFQHFMLQDLDPIQVETFIRRWHSLAYADSVERKSKSDRLRRAITSFIAIRELAQNPLLLTLMALLNRHQELPRDRAELYEQASRLLLQQWDASRALRDDPLLANKGFDYKDKQHILRNVAMYMQTRSKDGAGNLIIASELEDILVEYLKQQSYQEPRSISDRLIRQLRERNFILCYLGGEYYAFVHRTFLEFFCASSFVRKFEKEKTISFNELQQETFQAHWKDERWNEVLALIAGQLETRFAGLLIKNLLKRKDSSDRSKHLFLAAKCFSEIRNVSSLTVLSKDLKKRLKKLVRHGSSGWGRRPDDFGGVWSDSGDVDQEQTDRQNLGPRAVRAVALCWPKIEETKDWLKELVATSRFWDVRRAAVQEVARGWRDDPETVNWLRTIAETDKYSDVREAALQEVARDEDNAEEIVQWLQTRGRVDGYFSVRETAACELLKRWKHHPSTLRWIRDRSGFYNGWRMVFAAFRSVARSQRDIPDTLKWLKQIANADESWLLKQAATSALTNDDNLEPSPRFDIVLPRAKYLTRTFTQKNS